jgi:hypothetical protein
MVVAIAIHELFLLKLQATTEAALTLKGDPLSWPWTKRRFPFANSRFPNSVQSAPKRAPEDTIDSRSRA